MKTIQFVLTAQVPDDEDEAVVERLIDKMLENSHGYVVQVEPVDPSCYTCGSKWIKLTEGGD